MLEGDTSAGMLTKKLMDKMAAENVKSNQILMSRTWLNEVWVKGVLGWGI